MRAWPTALALAVLSLRGAPEAPAQGPTPLAPGVRGLATKAARPILVDGKLDEWGGAFCTPVHYNHARLDDRAAQFFYAWDDRALFIGLRALDRHRANVVPLPGLADGDAVELYLDLRAGQALRGKDWTKGAVHLFYSPFEGVRVAPRWVVRGGIATSDVKLQGVEIAATILPGDAGYEVEFKVPWANFPDFKPVAGSILGIDAELCSGDGARRTDRTFAYGSPLSVQQPASQGLVELVDGFDQAYLKAVGAAAFPLWVETPWNQPERARVVATLGIPPGLAAEVGEVEVRLHAPDGKVAKAHKARVETFGPAGLGFVRAVASWPIDDFPPGTYFATAQVNSKAGQPLANIAPRMVQEAQMSGR